MDLVVFRVKNRETGKETFMSDPEIAGSRKPDQWEKLQPVVESREGYFLEVNGRRAVELGLADAVVSNRRALDERYGLHDDVVVLSYTTTDRVVDILNAPLVTGLLFVVGLVALYVEFCAPGIGLGGLTAALCFGVFFWSHFLGGTAGWLEVVLFVSAFAFLAVELFVLPGFGVAGLTGVLLLLASLVLACQGAVVPETPAQWTRLTTTLGVVAGSCVMVFAIAYVLNARLGMIPVLNRLILQPPTGSAAFEPAQAAHGGIAPGDRGVALSLLRPAGKARFGDRLIDVVTEGDFIKPGRPLQVVQIAGNHIIVAELQTSD